MTDFVKTGTTTVGIVCKDCVVLAADTRATMGNFIADANVDKVLPISDSMAITIAGTASSAQIIAKHIQSELKLQSIKSGRDPTVKEAANLLRNWTYGLIRRPSMVPDVAHIILAGQDKYGVHLYEIGADGFLGKDDKYRVSGSGTFLVLGVLETKYKEGMTQAEGIKLAEECVDTAIQRDAASGNGINVFVIDQNGVKKVLSKRVNTHLQ